MPDVLPDRFRHWFEFERESHARVLESLASVPPERRSSAEYRKAVDLLAHIVAARAIWLARLEGSPPYAGPRFPQDARVEDVVADWSTVEGRWTEVLARLDDRELARVVAYRMIDGTACENTAEEILTQLFGHSLYHRGQIAVLVRAAGGTPAETDFIHWARRSS